MGRCLFSEIREVLKRVLKEQGRGNGNLDVKADTVTSLKLGVNRPSDRVIFARDHLELWKLGLLVHKLVLAVFLVLINAEVRIFSTCRYDGFPKIGHHQLASTW